MKISYLLTLFILLTLLSAKSDYMVTGKAEGTSTIVLHLQYTGK